MAQIKTPSSIPNTSPKILKPNNSLDLGCKTMMTSSKKIKKWNKKRNQKSLKVIKNLTNSSRTKPVKKINQSQKKQMPQSFKQISQTFSSDKRKKSKLKGSLHQSWANKVTETIMKKVYPMVKSWWRQWKRNKKFTIFRATFKMRVKMNWFNEPKDSVYNQPKNKTTQFKRKILSIWMILSLITWTLEIRKLPHKSLNLKIRKNMQKRWISKNKKNLINPFSNQNMKLKKHNQNRLIKSRLKNKTKLMMDLSVAKPLH